MLLCPQVYFPGENTYWYDVSTGERHSERGAAHIPVTMDRIPVFQRGGTIVPKKERVRRSSALMRNDPYTLVVALDAKAEANGTLYVDDGISYEYRDGKHLYIQFSYSGKKTEQSAIGQKLPSKRLILLLAYSHLYKNPAPFRH
jgi:alpha 1,3-glucosidase